jgi:hypothetical protein
VSPSRHFCNSIRNISPVEREIVAHGQYTRGQQWQWQCGGRCFAGLGCGGRGTYSRPQNAPLRVSASPLPTVRHLTAFTPGQIFNNELTHDPKKRIDTRNVARSIAYCKLSKLLDSTRELQKDQSTGRGRFRRRLNQVLQAVNNHAVVGDILIQGQGGTAALVWSFIRLLLRVT